MWKSRPTYTITRGTSVLLGLFILILLTLNMALIIQNKNLKRTLTAAANNTGLLNVGNLIPPLSGLDMDGNEFTVDYRQDSRKAVLLVFSPRCGFCTMNMPNWKAIIQGIDRNAYRLVAVSVESDGVKEYLDQNGFSNIPVMAEINPGTKVAYGINATPQTVLIDSLGRVEKVWIGVIESEDWRDVEQSLTLKAVTIK
jgi:peroxiredoxin